MRDASSACTTFSLSIVPLYLNLGSAHIPLYQPYHQISGLDPWFPCVQATEFMARSLSQIDTALQHLLLAQQSQHAAALACTRAHARHTPSPLQHGAVAVQCMVAPRATHACPAATPFPRRRERTSWNDERRFPGPACLARGSGK
jgi:hypothetical protein